MSTILNKTRTERELFTVGPEAFDLADGETIGGVGDVTIRVLKRDPTTGAITDETADFGPDVVAVTADGVVTFWLEPAATADDQAEGRYTLEVLATTSQGRVTAATDRHGSLVPLQVRAA